jgi:endonuclease YncB( thermonuclease family)
MRPLHFLPAVLAIALAMLSLNFARATDPIVGRATVVDGDTIDIKGERIRLHGVDAPESWQECEDGDDGTYRCGKESAFALDKFLAASRPTRCEILERDRYDRFVGVCFRADHREVNRWLAESRLADFSQRRYLCGLFQAKSARLLFPCAGTRFAGNAKLIA